MTVADHGKRREWWNWVFVALVTLVISMLLTWPFVDRSLGGDQYAFLARNFLSGRLSVDDLPDGYGDFVSWHGHKYLPFGPLPALLLIPFLYFIDNGMPIAIVGYLAALASVWLLFKILVAAKFDEEKRKWIVLFYFAGTPFLGVLVVGISTYFAQVVATLFLLGAVLAIFRRHALLAGVLLGLAAASRMTELFAAPFFLWTIYATGGEGRESQWRKGFALFSAGLAIPVVILMFYNVARFGDAFETGFGMARLYTGTLDAARAEGLFSLAHIPKNLYMMLIAGPQPYGGSTTPLLRFPFIEPSHWGMSVFLTSPALVYLFRSPRGNSLTQACWFGLVAVLLPIITYYGIGYVQFGYRYALDFMPFLILLAGMGMRESLTNFSRALITASVLVCVWGAVWVAVWI